MNDVIDYQAAKNQLYLYSKTAQSEIENVMILWKLTKEKPEVNNLLNELADLRRKDNLTTGETTTLMTILRMRFDQNFSNDEEILNDIVSISEKLGLPDFFVNDLKNDLKVK